MKEKAVVLLSGGIDSSTALAVAKAEGYELYALTFDYCQRHKRELESAEMVAGRLGVEKHLVMSFDMREIGGSALTADIEVPKDSSKPQAANRNLYKENTNPLPVAYSLALIPVTYVPARNTVFLSFALGWAETLRAEYIFIGANAVDYSGYPDCRPEYLKAFEEMSNLATKASVEGGLRYKIAAPLLFMTKGEIIKKGLDLGLDYSLTWSCYDPQTSNKLQATSGGLKGKDLSMAPCGRCDSCLFREKGFREAGAKDPLA